MNAQNSRKCLKRKRVNLLKVLVAVSIVSNPFILLAFAAITLAVVLKIVVVNITPFFIASLRILKMSQLRKIQSHLHLSLIPQKLCSVSYLLNSQHQMENQNTPWHYWTTEATRHYYLKIRHGHLVWKDGKLNFQ